MNASATPQAVSISDLKREREPREMRLPAVSPGFGDLQSFELLQRAGKLMSASPLVPDIYRGAEGFPSCVIALNMALRMQADPLMVMQNLDVIHGRPSWRSTFLIACFNQCGRFSAIRYRWQGTEGKNDWGCRAWAVEKSTGEEISGPLVTIALAKEEGWYDRKGSKWKTIPELMLIYRAAAWMVRTHAPEIAMGLQTREEVEDIITLSPEEYSTAQVAAGEHAGRRTQAAKAPEPAATTSAEPERKPAETGAGEAQTGTTVVTYAIARQALESAKTEGAQDIARDLIRGVADAGQRKELEELARLLFGDVPQ